MNKSSYIHFLTFLLTFIFVSVFYQITGFKYSISNGLNINLLFDLILWGILYFIFDWILSKLINKKGN
ncbi:Uncharacterised protein [[Clostridium] sordellii]|nr:Uncharacterised protein [[Clostridium] sordellii] [Paeniclostridium sordellii]CEN23877.1 Uncharacterised protein [[Clostridium] sordellii] [Paeniclostridium sordellii]